MLSCGLTGTTTAPSFAAANVAMIHSTPFGRLTAMRSPVRFHEMPVTGFARPKHPTIVRLSRSMRYTDASHAAATRAPSAESAMSVTGAPPSITQENWKNTLFVSAGAEYRWNEKLTLRGGVAWDQTPVPEGFRTPRIPDNSRVWLSIGASYAVTQRMILTAAYSHLFARDATVNLSDPGPANTNLFRGNVVANYRLNANILSAQLRVIF